MNRWCLSCFFESVQRVGIPDSRGESIPEGGGCDTEGSVAKGFQFGALDGEQPVVGGPQLKRGGVGLKEVRDVCRG